VPLSTCYKIFCIFAIFAFASCAPQTESSPTPQAINVYARASTQLWLHELYDCAPASAAIRLSDSSSADIRLQLGETNSGYAYQIGSDDLLIVTHRQSPAQNLSADEARFLFAGQSGLDLQVWVYAEGDDVQRIFNETIMQGTAITSQAMIAADTQQMSGTLNNTINAVGILPRAWKMGDSRDVYTISNVPVLAIVKSEPQGAIKEIIACLQK
jgi:hypothetical protein